MHKAYLHQTSSELNALYDKCVLNPFLVNVSILYPLKTPENQRFSGVFWGHKMGTLTKNGLNKESWAKWVNHG